MPENRIVERVYDGKGNLLEEVTATISDEQLADEAEEKALAKVGQLVDAITNLADAKVFLKRLCARLIKKGLLP